LTHASCPDWSGRLAHLATRLVERQLDALVVSTPANVTYLSGFSGSSGLLLVSASAFVLVVDGRYGSAAGQARKAGTLGPVALELVEERYDLTLAALLSRLAASRVGFEAGHLTVATLGGWQRAAPAVAWTATEGLVEAARAVKDDWEIGLFRDAGARLAGVARQVGSFVAAGRTEREVARLVDGALEQAGFSAPAFPTIVASGPHSAHPHARPTARRLTDGDLVVLDFGGVLGGYSVDLTRTAGIGQVAPRLRQMFTAVREAQRAALAVIRGGVPASAVDRAARETLEAQGFGAAFVHATGHGLGLELHEAPRIARAAAGASGTLVPGMVCTVEPGAYVEGLGGVRLEDDVLVTADGCEVLTDAPRELLVV
jgi:Xaa-Pro aminopeptidase